MKRLFFLVIILYSFSSCELVMDHGKAGLDIENITQDSLFVYINTDNKGKLYPDTTLPMKQIGEIVSPESNHHISLHFSNFNDLFNKIGTDTISVFIINKDSIAIYGWYYIKDNYKILKRYDLSSKDIEYLHEYLTYPPSPKMSTIKMYPPYKE